MPRTAKQPAAKPAPKPKAKPKVAAPVESVEELNLFADPPSGQSLEGELNVIELELRVKRNHPDAVMPFYATPGAACFDLHAIDDGVVLAGRAVTFQVGLNFEVPPGYVMKVYSRSGHGFKSNVRLVNTTGIIDSDYRGPMMVGLYNDGDDRFIVRKGDRIAQAMIERALPVKIIEVDELTETERGSGGFGSTGA